MEPQGRPLYSPAPELPANFAERLLELELEIETNCCLPLVNELMELYQQAIEYYENEGDSKYVDLQTRMHKTLMRPDVLLVLKANNSRPLVASAAKMPEIPASLSSAQTQELIRKKKDDFARSLRPHTTEFQRSLEPVAVPIQVARSLNKMFETHETSTKSVAQHVQSDVVRQDESLKNRLSQRISSRKSSKAGTPSLDQRFSNVDMEAVARKLSSIPTNESPPAPRKYSSSAQLSPREGSTAGSSEAGEGRMQSFDDLEKKLEEVMEKSYAEKHDKLEEIRKKYEAEMKEMQADGPATGLILQVLQQTKVAMEQEMQTAILAIDEKRRKEVQQVRLQYLARTSAD